VTCDARRDLSPVFCSVLALCKEDAGDSFIGTLGSIAAALVDRWLATRDAVRGRSGGLNGEVGVCKPPASWIVWTLTREWMAS
jgi:hypothetical protein